MRRGFKIVQPGKRGNKGARQCAKDSYRTGAVGYFSAIGKMLFTQDSTKLQKLCPYLHVVSLLRDQIPGRAWNPDNSSFDPVPVGSTTRPLRPSFPLTLSAPENEWGPPGGEKKITGGIPVVLKKKKNRGSPAGWIVIPVSAKRSRHKKCLDRGRMYFAIFARDRVYRSLYHVNTYTGCLSIDGTNKRFILCGCNFSDES